MPISSRHIKIISRNDIPALRTVIVGGQEHNLGILKDFRRHPELAAFIPEQARLSISWVYLEPSEVLLTHVHPTSSMIVIAHGEGCLTGDLDRPIEGGDIVMIPPGCHHGFIGAGTHGFWALSIQFEGEGLYENPEQARVYFDDTQVPAERERAYPGYYELLRRNQHLALEHQKNPIFELVSSGRLAEKRRRNRFFDSIQVWSECFQRALLARSALTEDHHYSSVFRGHLNNEFGHDAKLASDRASDLSEVWDPVIDAASHWFAWKMLSLDNADKTVLIHLVLEVGSNLISKHACATLADLKETDYFAVHAIADIEHEKAGLDLIRKLEEVTYERLYKVQAEGWDMLNLLCGRIAEVADGC